MENVQESRTTPKIPRTDLNSGSRAKAYKYAFGILLFLSRRFSAKQQVSPVTAP